MRNALICSTRASCAIGLVDLALDQPLHARVLREAGEAGVGHVVGARPVGHRLEVDLDQRDEILAGMAEHDGLGEIGARPQRVLDERGRDGLAAGGDEEVARAVDEAQAAVAPFADVAGAHPAVGAEHGLGGLRVVPVALEQVGRAHQDLAVLGELHLEALGDRADVARPRERPALSGDDAARRLGLAVHLAHVDAQHVPHRHGLGGQRRAARDHQLQVVEADLVEHRAEHGGAPGRVRQRVSAGCRAGPAALDVAAREGHGAVVGQAAWRASCCPPAPAPARRASAGSAAR